MSLLDKASLVITPNAYKTSKLYSVIPNTSLGDMDVVRNTTATRVNSLGLIETVGLNVPRIDYSNGNCPSILIEPQRTNLATYSSNFTTWDKSNNLANVPIITSNYSISPDGTQNADRIQLSLNEIYGYSILSKTMYIFDFPIISFSIYLKSNNSNSRITLFGSGISDNKIILTNEWVRYSFSGLSTQNPVLFYLGLFGASGDSLTADFSAWGFQVEVGSYPTSYIPTTSSTVTRNEDFISKSGISNLIGQTEGTIYWEGIAGYGSGGYYNVLPIIRNSDYSQRIWFGIQSTGYIQIVSSTVPNETSSAPIPLNQKSKIALRYKNNDWALFLNGVKVWSKSTTVEGGNFDILEQQYGGGYLSTNRVGYNSFFKIGLTDTECANLTTL